MSLRLDMKRIIRFTIDRVREKQTHEPYNKCGHVLQVFIQSRQEEARRWRDEKLFRFILNNPSGVFSGADYVRNCSKIQY